MPRPRTSNKALKARGSKRARKVDDVDPEKLASLPDPPAWITPAASGYWPAVVRPLVDADLVCDADLLGLAELCEALALAAQARQEIAQRGLAIENPSTGRLGRNPAAGILEQAEKSIRDWSRRFGMTPSDRTGLPKLPPKRNNGNEGSSFTFD